MHALEESRDGGAVDEEVAAVPDEADESVNDGGGDLLEAAENLFLRARRRVRERKDREGSETDVALDEELEVRLRVHEDAEKLVELLLVRLDKFL